MRRSVFLRVRKEGGGDVPALASSLHMLESVVFRMVWLKAWPPRRQKPAFRGQGVRIFPEKRSRRETQRFLPWGRSDRALDRTVSDVCRQGCFATEGAWAVVPMGLPFGSRRSGALSFPSPAGAAHGSGNFETLSTLSPPFRNHHQGIYPYNRNVSRGLGINILAAERRALILASTFPAPSE